MRGTQVGLGIALAVLAGCQPPPADPGVVPPEIRPVNVVATAPSLAAPVSAVVREIAIGELGLIPTGIAVEPDTGRRLVLSSDGAIFDLSTGARLWSTAAAEAPFGFTDLAALGGGLVALTSTGDGFLVDLGTGSMAQHFCYEPDWLEPQGRDSVQISFALAHDAAGGRLYAQPRTYEDGGFGAVMQSFTASYDDTGGTDLAWWSLPIEFQAHGMVVLAERDGDSPRLLLGSGTILHRFDVAAGELRAMAGLDEVGVGDIAGLARDERAGTLLVLDGSRHVVIELRESALTLDR